MNLFQKGLVVLLAGGFGSPLQAQESDAERFAQTITTTDLERHLAILASDSLEGRGTGQIGQELAANYLANQFKEIGLLPSVDVESGQSYFQEVPLERTRPLQTRIEHKDQIYSSQKKILSTGDLDLARPTPFKTVFVGRGREIDFDGLKVKGKAVVYYGKSVEDRNEVIRRGQSKGANVFIAFNYVKPSQFDGFKSRVDSYLSEGRMTLAIPEAERAIKLVVPSDVAAELAGLDLKTLTRVAESKKSLAELKIKSKPQTLKITSEVNREPIPAGNVLGYLPGKSLKEELLVMTAHYDHLGKTDDVIYNGADDDGSGTSAILEIAEAFALASKEGFRPKRSLLFMAVTAEENGLLGSQYYSEHPIFPLDNTVVNLNIDMIGRTDDRHENEDYVYLIGSDKLSQELHELSETVNDKHAQLFLDYRYNDEKDPNRFYYRSDHYNFAKNNIPIIFYFSGVHEDYHRPTDTIEKIQFSKVEKTARLVFYTAWEIANRPQRIKVN